MLYVYLYIIKVILILVRMELVGLFHAMFHDGGGGVAANSSFRFVSFHMVCCVIFSPSLALALSSFSNARSCLVMLEICLFHAEPVHKNIIQYCVTYTASYYTLKLYWTLHILLSLALCLSCIHFYIGFICKPHSIRK